MRIRALLLIPALVAAVLTIGTSGASAATLFLTNNHAANNRVTIGATATATNENPIELTNSAGGFVSRCTHVTLHLRLIENTVARTSLDVYAGNIPPNTCHPLQATTTHTPPWRLTITGAGTMIGNSTSYAGTLHNVAFDLAPLPGHFTGNLEDLTVTQNTTITNEICIDANRAGPATNPTVGSSLFIDARLCLTGHPATTWSLT